LFKKFIVIIILLENNTAKINHIEWILICYKNKKKDNKIFI
jgi:hypothetical protein